MTEAKGGVSLEDALEGFLGEHGRCWRVSGEDLDIKEDGLFLQLACPGCEASLTVPRTRT
jgi:hypothetical protein